MPRSRDEAETMADATGLTGVAREAFIGRLTGGAPPAAPEPAPATPKATVQRSAPTTKSAPRSALLVTPPAPKPATPVAAAPPKPVVRPAYQMEEQVVVGSRPASPPPVSSRAPSGTLSPGDDRLFTPIGVTREQNEALRRERAVAERATHPYGPEQQTPIRQYMENHPISAIPGAVEQALLRPEKAYPAARPPLSPMAQMLHDAQGVKRTDGTGPYKAPPDALSPDVAQRREQVREALGMPGDNGSAPPATAGGPNMPVLDPRSKAAVSLLLTKPGVTNESIYKEYLSPDGKGVVALQRDALMHARGQTR